MISHIYEPGITISPFKIQMPSNAQLLTLIMTWQRKNTEDIWTCEILKLILKTMIINSILYNHSSYSNFFLLFLLYCTKYI